MRICVSAVMGRRHSVSNASRILAAKSFLENLEAAGILTRTQVLAYNRLRGYAADPCAAVPEGHDAALWKRHNGCPG